VAKFRLRDDASVKAIARDLQAGTGR